MSCVRGLDDYPNLTGGRRGASRDTLGAVLAERVRGAVLVARALRGVGWDQLGVDVGVKAGTVRRAVTGSARMSAGLAVRLLLWVAGG